LFLVEDEQLHDVEGDAEVDEEQHGEVLSGDVTLGQEPAAYDEQQKHQLVNCVDEGLLVQVCIYTGEFLKKILNKISTHYNYIKNAP